MKIRLIIADIVKSEKQAGKFQKKFTKNSPQFVITRKRGEFLSLA
ncbi:hypothetical protein F544_22250 [Bibersteinia trehalosi USDA-ARS-USMARC-190]|uniref:Uncharacterized protein n=1 Tax=Bibersteinia trehalosi USDA-ARS-USMARC-190 TaxID=1263832 RepID=W0RDJ4_BIBTR|nr:hypothetical protein F544_22250 [Bibersteinia trehalosi USDA-ARS-USMARC-190]